MVELVQEGLDTTASTSPIVRGWTPPPAFDEYRILHLLGRGAMGQVYLAQDTLLDRLVAVKFIATRVPAEGDLRTRFRVEARAIARLHHPNVVMVYRVGEVQGEPYLVSEYVRGERLDELVTPVPWPRLLTIAIDLSRGLAAAHRHGVLHRDIKPANAMVAPDGVTKLLDFGLAKLFEASAVTPSDAQDPLAIEWLGMAHRATLELSPATGAVVGTPLYLAPEVWRQEPATRNSDIYSLGVVLYELATGGSPYAGKSIAELRAAVTTTPLRTLGEVAGGLDARFAAVVDRCVAIDPAQRFESGDAVRDALEALLVSVPVDRATLVTPYSGLRPLAAEHRAVFFGRDGEVRAVIDRLRDEAFVLVAGDSGVGTSSMVAAGVVPALGDAAAPELVVARLVPGRRPLAALVAALAPVCEVDEAELGRRIDAAPAELVRLLRRRRAPVVVVIDQLEELVTIADPAEASAAADLLCVIASAGAPGVRLIATVRADFLARVAALSRLGAELPRAIYLLAPLSAAGARAAILSPAHALGWSFESERTVEALVDASAGPGALPLLAFALAELWEARDPASRTIPSAALDSIGGVEGALARHADAMIAGLLPADRAAAQQILILLVTAEGTRARRTELELARGAAGDRTHIVLEALVRGRVVVARPAEHDEPTYELAHDALIAAWGTLRGWLNHQAEAHAARARVEHAAAEWHRLGKPREALWHGRQLIEARLARSDRLGPREREFLRRSHATARRRRIAVALAIAAFAVEAAVAYGADRWIAHRARDGEIVQRIAEADVILERARTRASTLETERRQSLADFDAGRAPAGEHAWDGVVAAADALELDYDLMQQPLERALLLDASRADVERRLAEAIYDGARAAEREHRLSRRDELLRRLQVHDADGEVARRWSAPARLHIAASDDAIRFSIQRYDDVDGSRRLSTMTDVGAGREAVLAPGSYLVTGERAGRSAVRYPVFVERGEQLDVALDVPVQVPAGFVYIAAGRFLAGSVDQDLVRRTILPAPPLHTLTTPAYVIARTEVTMRQWIAFLGALPPEERARRRPRGRGSYGTVELVPLDDGRWQFVLAPARAAGTEYRVTSGERLRYLARTAHSDQDWLDFPVMGVSWNDAQAYAAWVSGTVPGARLCNEREWERAARGADGRVYPHGDRLDATDTDFDMTYGQQDLAFGPDAVGLHPASDSPFGISDLAGNVWEWIQLTTAPHEAWYRGGSFYQDRLSARTNNRVKVDPETRSVQVGLRLCADAPAS
jgi:eukaryotic-like serine/threonine-protein kinase